MKPGAVSTNPDDRRIAEQLRAYGCTEYVRLDEGLTEPAQLDYLDLLPRAGALAERVPVTAVAVHQGTALLYLVDSQAVPIDAATLAMVQRKLANRSDPAWLGVLRPGSLEIYPIGFHPVGTAPVEEVHSESPNAPLFFQSLVQGTFAKNNVLHGSDYVYKRIFELLTQTTDEFVSAKKLEPLDVLSMAGRALFFRFLIDRRIVVPEERSDICPAANSLKDAFSSAEKAAQTSAWLDETFNGDFLRLIDESIPAENRAARQEAYLRFYRGVQRAVGVEMFRHLEAILNGWERKGAGTQLELDWGDLDFAHIPVGVLSQVYESFSHRADPETSRQTSVHYTPRTLARLMVDEVFASAKNPAQARVLDPACGAGIFLVLAFRRLVREYWLRERTRPDTRAIQRILYGQLRGFDVSESALRLASLALYITAIEVNGTQRPPKSLKFPRNLRGEVLFSFAEPKAAESQENNQLFTLGSLSTSVSKEFDGAFDIVLGNPPWTRIRDDEEDDTAESDALNNAFSEIGRRVLRQRGFPDLAEVYENPDKNPDLPFLWRSLEWAKKDALIALAMPARIFGRTSGRGFAAWQAVLRSTAITGIVNGSDLRWSAVWEGVKIPFCVLFLQNSKPSKGHRFYFTTPLNDPDLNRHGRFRIDYEATRPVSSVRLERQPWMLKALSLGTWLDVEVMESILQAFPKTLAQRWLDWNPEGDKTGQGFNRSPGLKQNADTFIGKLKVFERGDDFSVHHKDFETYAERYGRSTAHMPRTETLYQSPLVIIPQAPGKDLDKPRAYLADRPVAFSQSYYGYSCAGHPAADTFAALIYLLAQSTLFQYFCLMTSRRAGFDRLTFNKEEFDALPFPDVQALERSEQAALRRFATRMEQEVTKPWPELDSYLFRLYGLGDDAVQVARDTLFSAAAHRKQAEAGLERTTFGQRQHFAQYFSELLQPYFELRDTAVAVSDAFVPDAHDAWAFLAISRRGDVIAVNGALLRKAVQLANAQGCSRIIVRAPNHQGILLGLLNQRRWWTQTRARLCAQHVIREHLEAFASPAPE
ncbi:MAG TPA: N-6 DNA methylase [Lacipirellulaceae bacterium]|nr:N-6 DNA methylase [Lacipirellulaceae bacterium]